MNPGLVIKLRPAGPWRIGPDSGARNRVDVIYHSDSLFSAVTSAMARMGSLAEWLDATARTESPAVCFSSCFPFLEEIGFVVPPRTIWPPSSPALMSARVRWKSARFVPLSVVQSLLSGEKLNANHWSVDGASGCLVPAGKPGPFRTGVRWNAAVDRLSGASERHGTACIEFRPGSGLWTIVGFADEAARDRWQDPVKAAFRLLADTGFGGERSRGWGRAETPEFVEGTLPEMIIQERAAPVEPEPAVEASVLAPEVTAEMRVPPDPNAEIIQEALEAALEAAAAETGKAEEAVEAPVVVEPVVEAPVEVVAEASAAGPSGQAEGLPHRPVEPVVEAPGEVVAEAPVEAAAVEAAPEVAEVVEPVVEATGEVVGETPAAGPSGQAEGLPHQAVEPVVEPPGEVVTEVSAVVEPAVEAPGEVVAEAPVEPVAVEAVPEAPAAGQAEGLPHDEAHELAALAAGRPSGPPLQAHWLLSLFTPAAADAVDWGRGSYTVLARGGRIESPSGSGELKKQIQMVAEGSVLYADGVPRGAAADVAPDGFAHPVFRAGFALSIRLPEVH
jgi:CRISPR type III-A-associated RAMP protein Csm4